MASILWPKGLKKAITFSYDDAVLQDIRLIGLMKTYGVKGTFNLNSAFLGKDGFLIRDGKHVDHNKIAPEKIAEVYSGFEVAVHTAHHPTLTQLAQPQVVTEVMDDRRALEKLVGYPVVGMAYPNGPFNESVEQVLRVCGIEYSRTVLTTGKFSLPERPLEWACSCHHTGMAALIGPFLEDSWEAKLFAVWGHSYEFDQRDDWAQMEENLKEVGGRENVWYATNLEIFRYIAAYRSLVFSVEGDRVSNPSGMEVWLSTAEGVVSVPAGATKRL